MIKQDLLYSGRPIEESHIEIAATFEASGTRPIGKSSDFLLPGYLMTDSKIINQSSLVEIRHVSSSQKLIMSTDLNIVNQHSPIESHLEIAATFEASGTRPIGKSPDFLLPEYLMTDSKIISEHLHKPL